MLKKLFFPLVALFMLAGCATPPTTIDVSPKITLPQQDPSLMGVTVSINGADQRQDQALAKVTRDKEMVELDLRYPEYGFAQHKGYPTAFHLEKLAAYGATEHHRRSFAPVKRALGLLS